ASTPTFQPQTWVTDSDADASSSENTPSVQARDFQRALWLLQHDLTKCVSLGSFGPGWDTHNNNLEMQARASGTFFPIFARFLEELHTQRNRYGVLAEQTMVVCGSELGRFPVMNDYLGKDHWPEAPYLFFGPSIVTTRQRGPIYGA